MLSFISKLFGKKAVKQDEKIETGMPAQIALSIEKFKNRPIYKYLTEEIIDATIDDELVQTVFDNLTEKFPKDYTKEYETVMGLKPGQRAIYVIWCLEAEVNNGGFNQFYFNPSGQYADLVPDALKLIGAFEYARLAGGANAVYINEREFITRYQDGTLEGFSKSYQDNPLDKFDKEYYTLSKVEDLPILMAEFVRKNKLDFIDD